MKSRSRSRSRLDLDLEASQANAAKSAHLDENREHIRSRSRSSLVVENRSKFEVQTLGLNRENPRSKSDCRPAIASMRCGVCFERSAHRQRKSGGVQLLIMEY